MRQTKESFHKANVAAFVFSCGNRRALFILAKQEQINKTDWDKQL